MLRNLSETTGGAQAEAAEVAEAPRFTALTEDEIGELLAENEGMVAEISELRARAEAAERSSVEAASGLSAARAEADTLRKSLAAAVKERDELRAAVTSSSNAVDELRAEIERLQTTNDELNEMLNKRDADLSDAEARINELEDRNAQLERDFEEASQQVIEAVSGPEKDAIAHEKNMQIVAMETELSQLRQKISSEFRSLETAQHMIHNAVAKLKHCKIESTVQEGVVEAAMAGAQKNAINVRARFERPEKVLEGTCPPDSAYTKTVNIAVCEVITTFCDAVLLNVALSAVLIRNKLGHELDAARDAIISRSFASGGVPETPRR